jgi:hypothetical protein
MTSRHGQRTDCVAVESSLQDLARWIDRVLRGKKKYQIARVPTPTRHVVKHEKQAKVSGLMFETEPPFAKSIDATQVRNA